jgi:hypothetical protein
VAHGSAESGAMKDLGKPGAGELHARIDEVDWKRSTVSGPQRLQFYAWTAPDLSAIAPARLYPSTCEGRAGDVSYNLSGTRSDSAR